MRQYRVAVESLVVFLGLLKDEQWATVKMRLVGGRVGLGERGQPEFQNEHPVFIVTMPEDYDVSAFGESVRKLPSAEKQ